MTDEDDDAYKYKLTFKKEDGEKAKVKVSKETYNQA